MIRNAVNFVHDLTAASPRPWLVLGKGPTSDRLSGVGTAQYHVLTLNHACRLVTPALAHFVDIEAFLDCGEYLAQTETPVCLPAYPHYKNKAQDVPLHRYADLFGKNEKSQALAWLLAKEKVYGYNATTAPPKCRWPGLHRVTLRHFSAVGAFNLLALAGVRQVCSLGVDGGKDYGTWFSDLTPLTNGRDSFDAQFAEIDRTVREHKIEWTRL